MTKTYTSADVARILDTTPGWQRTEKSPYPISFGGSHKYQVKAVTTPFFGSGEKKVRTYYVESISQLVFSLNQANDYIMRVNAGWYNTVNGTYITAHYVERIY